VWIAFLAFIAAFVSILTGGLLLYYRAEAASRLARIESTQQDAAILSAMAAEPVISKLDMLMSPFQRLLPKTDHGPSAISQRLTQAGFRGSKYANVLLVSKFAVPCLFGTLALVTGAFRLSPMFVFALALGLGYLAPDIWLRRRAAARKRNIRYGLPEALDLLVICMEAGLSLDRATLRTADELRLSEPAIADELGLVNLEQRAGTTRGEAWKHFGDRTGVDTVRALASVMIQADKFGTSIGKALRVHGEMLRSRRRQEAEERAAKTTVKLVFPLVLFIFPSLFVVTLGPSMIIMFEAFHKYLS
jgi:tight adherence protein C